MPTFKDSHDDNPSVCNDPAEDYKIGADTPTRSAGMNMDQLAQAISVRIGVNPPPQPTENLNQLVLTIQPNTLLANLQSVTGVTYDYYAILTDDDTEPVYPTAFTQGVLPQLVALSAWQTETKYVWVYDSIAAQKKELLDPNGVSGVTISPVDTRIPTAPTFTLTQGTGSLEIDWAITVAATDPTPGSGMSATPYRIVADPENDGTVILDSTAATSGTITVSGPGTYSWAAEASDVAGNKSYSTLQSITIAAAGAAGTVTLPTTAIDAVESDVNVVVGVTRTGGTVTGNVTVSTVEGYPSTATDVVSDPTNGQYTAASQVFTWTGSTNNTQNFTITLNDVTHPTNNTILVQIEWDNRDGAGLVVEREYVYINLASSSAGGVAGWQQETTSGDDLVSIEGESMTSVAGAAFDVWAEEGGQTRDSGGISMVTNTATDYGTSTTLDVDAPYLSATVNFTATGTHHFFVRATHKTNTAGRRCHLAVLRGVTSIGADGTGTGGAGFQLVTLPANHGYSNGDIIFFENASVGGYNNTTGYTISSAGTNVFDIPNTGLGAATGGECFGESSLLGMFHAQAATTFRDWQHETSTPSNITATISAVGSYEVRVYSQDDAYRFDKLVISTNASYEPDITDAGDSSNTTLDEAFGPVESVFNSSGAAVSDNPDNTTRRWYPLPTTTVVPTFVNPTDGASEVSQTIPVVANFAGMSNLEPNFMRVLNSSGDPVNGTETATAQELRFTPSSPYPQNSSMTADMSARVTDSGGTVKSARVLSPPWTFTTFNPAVGTTLFSQDFQGANYGIQTAANIEALFNNNITGTSALACINNGNLVIVDDPINSGRGKVLEVKHFKDMYALGKTDLVGVTPIPSGAQFNFAPNIAGQTNFYVNFDIFFPADHDWAASIKSYLVFSSGFVASSNPNLLGTQCMAHIGFWGNPEFADGILPICDIEGAMNFNRYDANRASGNWFGTTDVSNPTRCNDGSSPYTQWRVGEWNNVEMQVGLNSAAGVADGVARLWHNGNLVVSRTNVQWFDATDPTLEFDTMQFSTWHGGGTQAYAAPKDHSIYYGRLIVSTVRTGGG